MSHECPRNGCRRTVSADRLLCGPDWKRVPRPLQRAVWAAWKDGAGFGTPAHKAAIDAVIAFVNRDSEPVPDRPSPGEPWEQAGGGTDGYDRERYLDLLREHGHLLKPGDEGYEDGSRNLPCGWPGRGEDGTS